MQRDLFIVNICKPISSLEEKQQTWHLQIQAIVLTIFNTLIARYGNKSKNQSRRLALRKAHDNSSRPDAILLQEIFSKAPGQALQEGGGSFVGGGPLFEVCTPI